MKRARSCFLVAFIFLSGLLVGGFLGASIGWLGFFHKAVKGGPSAIAEIVIDRANHDLGLKPKQREQFRQVVRETSAELAMAAQDVRPKVEEILGRNEDRVRAFLDSGQRKKFDSFLAAGRRRWKQPAGAASPPPAPLPPVIAQPDAP